MGSLKGLDLPYYYIPSNPANYGGIRATGSIKYIVVHYTANDGDTDTGNGSYFSRTKVGAGAHYFVDEDSVTQSISDNRVAYHCQTAGMTLKCGCRNTNSIGVEMCSDKANGKYVITAKTKENTVTLVKYLMQKYNVPTERVIRHYDVCGKMCPEPWVRVPSEWIDFKSRLEEDDMTEEKVREIAEKTANDMIYRYVTSKKEKVYNSVAEMPHWAQGTIDKLIKRGALNGTEKGLEISESLLRVLVINDRAGVYEYEVDTKGRIVR